MKKTIPWTGGRRARVALVLAAIAAATLGAASRAAAHGGTADIAPPSFAASAVDA